MSDVIAYTYEADHHCPACARARFGNALDDPDTEDGEGNPIGVIAPWDEYPNAGIYCGDCLGEIIPRVQVWVSAWFERDRASVVVSIGRDEALADTVAEWWDEEVQEAIDDGFLDAKNLKASALEYCSDNNLLKWGGETIEI